MTDAIIPGIDAEPRKREWIRIAVIFAVLMILILIPLLRWQHNEAHRPSLVEVRVVAATDSDPVFREGPRIVGADEQVSLAVALRLEYPNRGSRWVSPVDQLFLDGVPVDHITTDSWPEPDRTARTFWFTLEGPYLGGVLNDAEDMDEKLAVRPFLAPELGQGLLANGEPQSHADDDINLGESLVPVKGGTYRTYARVEVVADQGSSRPLFAATSIGSDGLNNPALVRISRGLGDRFPGINNAAGHWFRLPGFEPALQADWDLTEACKQLIATSSRTFAAAALTGQCEDATLDFDSIGQLPVTDSGILSTLQWQNEILPGDVLKQGGHWMVLVSDDGDGVLDGQDLVMHSWRRPPSLLPLASAIDDAPREIIVLRATVR